jgi:hypothetical protein
MRLQGWPLASRGQLELRLHWDDRNNTSLPQVLYLFCGNEHALSVL